MVVIRKSLRDFENTYGKDALAGLRDYADIIGYTIETENEEIRIELNPDRPDLLSFPTLTASESNFVRPSPPKKYKTDSGAVISLTDKGLKLRPYVLAFTARGTPISSNFDDLIDFQEKIHITVGKNRKKSSIGIHDLEKIKLPAKFDSVSAESIEFTTYDGTLTGTPGYVLKNHPKGIEYGNLISGRKSVPVILDREGDVLSMPPVINGKKSAVEENTKNFFVDITGTDLRVCIGTMFLMMYFYGSLGYDVRTATITAQRTDFLKEVELIQERSVVITSREVGEFIGNAMEPKKVITVLKKMGYEVQSSSFPLTVFVPPYRVDVMGPADILEDLAKGTGYENIEPRPISLGTIGSRNRYVEFADTLKSIILGAGFQEVMTFVVGSREKYSQVEYLGDVRIQNPKSLDYSVIRDRLSLGLLEFYQNNRNRSYPQNIFEIGNVVMKGTQENHFCISTASSKASFSEIKRTLDYVSRRIFGAKFDVRPEENSIFISGRSASLWIDGTRTGVMGEVRPEILEQFSMKVPVALAELDVKILQSIFSKSPDGK